MFKFLTALFTLTILFHGTSDARTHSLRLEILKEAVAVQYFATLPFRESPFADLTGIHHITADEAKTRNHFRFEYDAQWRPIRVVFMLADIPRSPNQTANFFFRTSRIDIHYTPGRETRKFYDRFGNAAKSRGIYREIYETGQNGYRTRLTFENPDGSAAQSSWGVAEYRWKILRDGTVVEDHYDLEGKVVVKRPNLTFYQLRLHYGPNGWLGLMENFGPEGKKLVNNTMNGAQDKLEYDANGDMRAWNVYDENEMRVKGNSPGVHRGLRDYDAHGYIIRSYYEDEDYVRMKSAYGWGETHTVYDRQGNMIERWTGTETGEPAINEKLNYSGYFLSWDKSGRNQISREFFNEDKKTPAIHARTGAHKVNFFYNRAGNKIREEYRAPNGQLVRNRALGAAIVTYKYDSDHRLIEKHLFDEGQNPITGNEGWAGEKYDYNEYGFVSPIRQ